MFAFNHIRKKIVLLLVIVMSSLQAMPVQAAMVNNDDLLKQARAEVSIERLASMLDHEGLQQKLADLGVDPISARARINQMTDLELAELSQNLEELPAGSGVLGVVLTVFIVFVITDMLGATDVFPFVKNINR